MAATDIGTGNIPPIDDLDDSLFDYDAGDVFRDVDTNMDIPAVQKPAARADEKENGANLGIDKEIKVTKKRASVPKLDENRFASITARMKSGLLNGSQAPVTCRYPKATESCKRAVEV